MRTMIDDNLIVVATFSPSIVHTSVDLLPWIKILVVDASINSTLTDSSKRISPKRLVTL